MKILYVLIVTLTLCSCASTNENQHNLLAGKFSDQIGLNEQLISWLESDLKKKSAWYQLDPDKYQGFPEYSQKAKSILKTAANSMEELSIELIKSDFTVKELEKLTQKRDNDTAPLESSEFKLKLVRRLQQYLESDVLPKLWGVTYEYEDGQFVKYIGELSKDSKSSFAKEATDCASFYKVASENPGEGSKYTYMNQYNKALNTVKLLNNNKILSSRSNARYRQFSDLFSNQEKGDKRIAQMLLACGAVVGNREERASFWKKKNPANLEYDETIKIHTGIGLDNNKSLLVGATQFYPTKLSFLAGDFYNRYKVLSTLVLDNNAKIIKYQAYPQSDWIYEVIGAEQIPNNELCVLAFSDEIDIRELKLVVFGINEKGGTLWASYPSLQLQNEDKKNNVLLQGLDNVAITGGNNNCVIAYTTVTNEKHYNMHITSYSSKGKINWSKTIKNIGGSSIVFKYIKDQDYYVGVQERSENKILNDVLVGADNKINSVRIYLYRENNDKFSRSLYSANGDIGRVKIMFIDKNRILVAKDEFKSTSILLLNLDKNKITQKTISADEYYGIYNLSNTVATLFKNEMSVYKLINQSLIKTELTKLSFDTKELLATDRVSILELSDNRYLLHSFVSGGLIIDTTDVLNNQR